MVEISAARADNDRGVLSCWHEWEICGRDRRVVLCVETTLELRPGHAGFDRQQLDELIEHATALMHASGTPVDALRIMPAPANPRA